MFRAAGPARVEAQTRKSTGGWGPECERVASRGQEEPDHPSPPMPRPIARSMSSKSRGASLEQGFRSKESSGGSSLREPRAQRHLQLTESTFSTPALSQGGLGGARFEPRFPWQCSKVSWKVRLLSTGETRREAPPLISRMSGGRTPVDKVRIGAHIVTASSQQIPSPAHSQHHGRVQTSN